MCCIRFESRLGAEAETERPHRRLSTPGSNRPNRQHQRGLPGEKDRQNHLHDERNGSTEKIFTVGLKVEGLMEDFNQFGKIWAKNKVFIFISLQTSRRRIRCSSQRLHQSDCSRPQNREQDSLCVWGEWRYSERNKRGRFRGQKDGRGRSSRQRKAIGRTEEIRGHEVIQHFARRFHHHSSATENDVWRR